MSTDRLGNYLADLGALLKQEALDAKTQALQEVGKPGHPFALGRLTAYYEVLSLMKQQADAFGMKASEISLQDFDVDRDLLANQ
jgi:hypothetical protein